MIFPENIWLSALVFGLLGYLSGSLSFALWITRLVKGMDVRDAGSKHATTTNTIHQAGWGAGALVLLLDIAKGFFPVFLAARLEVVDWVVALTAAMAVVGHCWPVFAGFRGGMGLATAGGGSLAVSPLGFAISLGVLITLVLTIRHAARASMFAGLAFVPVLWLFGQRGTIIPMAAAVGLVLAARFTIDWRRKYRVLWLDREQMNNGRIRNHHPHR